MNLAFSHILILTLSSLEKRTHYVITSKTRKNNPSLEETKIQELLKGALMIHVVLTILCLSHTVSIYANWPKVRKLRVHTFNVEHMPWNELKPEHVRSWRHIYLWLDSIDARKIKEFTSYQDLPREKYHRFVDSVDYKLLPGAPSVIPANWREFTEYTIPSDHIPGLITEENFKQVIPVTYTPDFYEDYVGYEIPELPSKIIGTAALGGFKYLERHLMILRPVIYKYDTEGNLRKKSLTLGEFFAAISKYYESTLSEKERANLVVPQSVTFWKC